MANEYVPKVDPQVVLMGYLGTTGAATGELAGYLAGTAAKGE